MNKIEKYVDRIIKKMNVSRKEKQEYRFQFIDHINSLKEDYMRKDILEDEAINLAIKEFGDEKQILDTGEFPFSRKQIITITLFGILITLIALYFQWADFYKGYSSSSFNLLVSIMFLLIWLVFSIYWRIIEQNKYRKFITVYWSINIIIAVAIWLFANNKFMQSVLFPFYIWYGGPMYGFKHIFFRLNIDVKNIILVTSPLGMLCCFTGYWFGGLLTRFKKSRTFA